MVSAQEAFSKHALTNNLYYKHCDIESFLLYVMLFISL